MTLIEKLKKDGYNINPKSICPYLNSLMRKYLHAKDFRPEKCEYYYQLIVEWISAPAN